MRESLCMRLRGEAGRGWGLFLQVLAVAKRFDEGAGTFFTKSTYVARHSRRWVEIREDNVRRLGNERHSWRMAELGIKILS